MKATSFTLTSNVALGEIVEVLEHLRDQHQHQHQHRGLQIGSLTLGPAI